MMKDSARIPAGRLAPGKAPRELTADVLAKIVGGVRPAAEHRSDDHALAASLLGGAQDEAKLASAQAPATDEPAKLTPPTGFVTDKLFKIVDRKDAPLYEKTLYQSPSGEKPSADKPLVDKGTVVKPASDKVDDRPRALSEAPKTAVKSSVDESRALAPSDGGKPSATSEPIKLPLKIAAADKPAIDKGAVGKPVGDKVDDRPRALSDAPKTAVKSAIDEPRDRAPSDGGKPSAMSEPIKVPQKIAAADKPAIDKGAVGKPVGDKVDDRPRALSDAPKTAAKSAIDEPRGRAPSDGGKPSAMWEPGKVPQKGGEADKPAVAKADNKPVSDKVDDRPRALSDAPKTAVKSAIDEPRGRALSDGSKPSVASEPVKVPQKGGEADKSAAKDGKPASKLPSSAEIKGTYVLHAGKTTLTASADGTRSVTAGSQTSVYASAGMTDKDGLHPQLKAGIEHTAQIKATAKLSSAVTAEAKAEAKGEAGLSIDISKQGGVKAKVGVEVSADAKIEGTHKVAKDHDIVGSASANAKASAELSAGLTVKDGFKVKGEVGATAGAGLGGASKQGGHTLGGYAGLETGVGAAVSGAAGISDGKIKIALDAKLSIGAGAKIKAEVEYDTGWVKNSAGKIIAEAKDPNSALGKALAAAGNAPVQKAAVVTSAMGKELTEQGEKQGRLFGAPVKAVGEVIGTVGKVVDRDVSFGDKTLEVAKTGGKILASPVLDRIDAVKDAIAEFKAADNFGHKALAVGKGILRNLPIPFLSKIL